jgi:hypothetical protein
MEIGFFDKIAIDKLEPANPSASEDLSVNRAKRATADDNRVGFAKPILALAPDRIEQHLARVSDVRICHMLFALAKIPAISCLDFARATFFLDCTL